MAQAIDDELRDDGMVAVERVACSRNKHGLCITSNDIRWGRQINRLPQDTLVRFALRCRLSSFQDALGCPFLHYALRNDLHVVRFYVKLSCKHVLSTVLSSQYTRSQCFAFLLCFFVFRVRDDLTQAALQKYRPKLRDR